MCCLGTAARASWLCHSGVSNSGTAFTCGRAMAASQAIADLQAAMTSASAERLWSAVQVLTTAQGRRFKASLFTLPRIWAQIQVRLQCISGFMVKVGRI